MANQFIDFKQPVSSTSDTGEDASASIRPLTDGEPANASVLNRPHENLRLRTEVIRDAVDALKYLSDADRALLLECSGSVTWGGTVDAGGTGKFVLSAPIKLRPFLAPSATTPATCSIRGVVISTITAPVIYQSTSVEPPRAYSGANRTTIQFTGGVGSSFNVSVESNAPRKNVVVTFDPATTSRDELVAFLNGNGTFIQLGLSAAVGSGEVGSELVNAGSTWLTTDTQQMQGAADAEQHVITPAGLAAFFNTQVDGVDVNLMADGDVLCIWYDDLVNETYGGRRQSIEEEPEQAENADNNLFLIRNHPERVPYAIPVARVSNSNLVLINNAVFKKDVVASSTGNLVRKSGDTMVGQLFIQNSANADALFAMSTPASGDSYGVHGVGKTAGVLGAGSANGIGVKGTGEGQGVGVQGIGGAASGDGSGADGFSYGAGVIGKGGAGGAPGVEGLGTDDFPGVRGHGTTGVGVEGTGGTGSRSGVVGYGGTPDGAGVKGFGAGDGTGVYGEGSSDNGGDSGRGVHGKASGSSSGVYGEGGPSNGRGVSGVGGGTGSGVYGKGGATNGIGVEGQGDGTGAGVKGLAQSGNNAYGVHGVGGGTEAGVYGEGGGGNAPGVEGLGTGSEPGVRGQGDDGVGVEGRGGATRSGVYGIGGSTSGKGVYGEGTGTGVGVYGVGGDAGARGVEGHGTASSSGVYGVGGANNGRGVTGKGGGTSGTGVYAEGGDTVAESAGTARGYGVDGLGVPGVRGVGRDGKRVSDGGDPAVYTYDEPGNGVQGRGGEAYAGGRPGYGGVFGSVDGAQLKLNADNVPAGDLVSPEQGSLYAHTNGNLYYYDGTEWVAVNHRLNAAVLKFNLVNNITLTNTNTRVSVLALDYQTTNRLSSTWSIDAASDVLENIPAGHYQLTLNFSGKITAVGGVNDLPGNKIVFTLSGSGIAFDFSSYTYYRPSGSNFEADDYVQLSFTTFGQVASGTGLFGLDVKLQASDASGTATLDPIQTALHIVRL